MLDVPLSARRTDLATPREQASVGERQQQAVLSIGSPAAPGRVGSRIGIGTRPVAG